MHVPLEREQLPSIQCKIYIEFTIKMHPAALKHRQNKSFLIILVSASSWHFELATPPPTWHTASTRRQTLFQHRVQRSSKSPKSPEADAHMWLLDWVVSFNQICDIGINVFHWPQMTNTPFILTDAGWQHLTRLHVVSFREARSKITVIKEVSVGLLRFYMPLGFISSPDLIVATVPLYWRSKSISLG